MLEASQPGSSTQGSIGLARRLGLFDATMIVMGGIIGSGIFRNPSSVARIVHTPAMILGAWIVGGVIALLGAFIYAELAARRPEVGGQYAYLRESYNPVIAFLFGWTLFFISDTGGMAAVAMVFAHYFTEIIGAALPDWSIAVAVIAVLAVINCLGVRVGGTVQNIFMVTKILAILMLIGFGLKAAGIISNAPVPASDTAGAAGVGGGGGSLDFISTFGGALVPVMFAYGGWQTANFIAGEIREPQKNLPRGLLLGVIGVIALYVSVTYICVAALGPDGLAATTTPASAVMQIVLGDTGAKLIALGIAISAIGFLSQCVLVAPRVYFAMAKDGLFFKKMGWIHPTTRVPVYAIAAQAFIAILIIMWGKYEEILSYVVWNDFCFFGLTASCIFVLRQRELRSVGTAAGTDRSALTGYNMPGHPYTTGIFILAAVFIIINTFRTNTIQAVTGLVITLAGIPVYYLWRWWNRR